MHFQACCSLLLFWSSICWEKQQGCLEQKSSVPVLLLNRITVHCIQFLIQHHYPLCTNSAAINAHALSFKQAALHESVARFAAVHLLLSLSLSHCPFPPSLASLASRLPLTLPLCPIQSFSRLHPPDQSQPCYLIQRGPCPQPRSPRLKGYNLPRRLMGHSGTH